MLPYIKLIQEKVDGRVLRERVLIFMSAATAVFLIWNFIIQAPFDDKKKEMRDKIDAATSQSEVTQGQIKELSAAFQHDPDALKQEQIKQLQADINDADIKLQNASQGLVKVDQLLQMLEDVLQKTSKLTLLDVATLPMHELQVETVRGDSSASTNKAKNVLGVRNLGVYEHVVEMRVSGSYFQVIQFLTALEALPWRFYWQRLDYKVIEYPNAEIILRVYTLSSEEGLLGV